MTYAALQANSVVEPEVYISKADEDEVKQWEHLTGEVSDDSDEYGNDLAALGLSDR
jgi:hypothetical protein